jgi:putative transposase
MAFSASRQLAPGWRSFVTWYNRDHKHSSIGFVAPADRHAGRDVEIPPGRRAVYERAKHRHPERW